MSTAMDDIEQECEDAVFAVCDARERYPIRCADELAECIALENDIYTAPVKKKPITPLEMPKLTSEQEILFRSLGIGTKDSKLSFIEQQNKKLEKLVRKIDDLKIVKDQIKREKYCEINKLLEQNKG